MASREPARSTPAARKEALPQTDRVPDESRTWEEPDVKLGPVNKDDPTNADLLNLILNVHDCVEDGKRVTKRAVAQVAKKAEAARIEAVAARKDITSIRTALGLTEGKKHVSGLQSPFKAYVRSAMAAATAMGALVLVYRATVAIAPGVWAFLLAVNEAILSGKF